MQATGAAGDGGRGRADVGGLADGNDLGNNTVVSVAKRAVCHSRSAAEDSLNSGREESRGDLLASGDGATGCWVCDTDGEVSVGISVRCLNIAVESASLENTVESSTDTSADSVTLDEAVTKAGGCSTLCDADLNIDLSTEVVGVALDEERESKGIGVDLEVELGAEGTVGGVATNASGRAGTVVRRAGCIVRGAGCIV